ncbi:MAG: hypothetical protein RSD12_05980, partial [Akkermansia sp.]
PFPNAEEDVALASFVKPVTKEYCPIALFARPKAAVCEALRVFDSPAANTLKEEIVFLLPIIPFQLLLPQTTGQHLRLQVTDHSSLSIKMVFL